MNGLRLRTVSSSFSSRVLNCPTPNFEPVRETRREESTNLPLLIVTFRVGARTGFGRDASLRQLGLVQHHQSVAAIANKMIEPDAMMTIHAHRGRGV